MKSEKEKKWERDESNKKGGEEEIEMKSNNGWEKEMRRRKMLSENGWEKDKEINKRRTVKWRLRKKEIENRRERVMWEREIWRKKKVKEIEKVGRRTIRERWKGKEDREKRRKTWKEKEGF